MAHRDHWAFQPIQAPDVSAADPDSRSPLDDFVAAGWREVGALPNGEVDRRTWIRRASFQITGLPPTLDAVRAYEHDRRPDARERVIDRLLRSPAFGERWGRRWLDLARYADSNGLDENFLFREAWRYRNWVLKAFDQDMPFDRFILEQIAGDLLPYRSVEQRDHQRIASGFLVMGPKVLLGVNPNLQRMDVADEQLRTIGRTFLGLTIGCARCHDHKFDPIPTADYYAMAGILTSTQVVQQRYMLGQQRVMERLVGLGPEGAVKNAAYERYWRELPAQRAALERAREARKLLDAGREEELNAFAQEHPEAVVAAALEAERAKDARLMAQDERIGALEALIANPPPIPPRAMTPADVANPADTEIRVRGAFDRKGALAPRGFLSVLSDEPPEIAGDESGRKALARWLVDVDHGAGALTARVAANRIWAHMIGRGLVRTVDNFGLTGERPTHPEMLDYLAQTLIDSGWSVKALVREIALSRAFALSSRSSPASSAIDPDNRWVWRGHRRRLEPEALRDAMLAVSGALDRQPLDSTVSYLGDQATAVGANKNRRRTNYPNRSVYLPVIRNDLPELFQAFDFADPHRTTGARPQTHAVTQSLFMLNDDTVISASESLAARALAWNVDGPEERVARLILTAFQSTATAEETTRVLAFIEEARERRQQEGGDSPEFEAWAMAAQALFASSRFQFLE